jgi:O-antigen/teichoic acid export membrane protein
MGVVIGFFIRAHFFPNFLSEAEIGVLALLVSYGSIFASVALLGFNHATIKYFPYFRNTKEGHGGFLSLYLLVIIAGFLIFLLIYKIIGGLLIDESTLFGQYYYLCIPLTIGLLIFSVMDNYNTVLYNASTGILLREFGLRLLVLLALVPLIYDLINFEQFAQIYVTAYSVIALCLIAFIIWRGECHLNFRFRTIERHMIRAMAGISFFGFLTGLNNVAILQVNNILIDLYYDEAQTGIYVTNFFFAALILLPSRGLNKIAPTLISDAFKNNNLQAIRNIQYKSTINQQLIAVLLLVGLYINLHNVYNILPVSFAIGGWVIILTGLANVIQMTGGVGSAIIGFSNYYRLNTYLSVLQLTLLVCMNMVFLPLWGITGAAAATLGTVTVLNILKFFILRRKFNIQPYHKKHLLVFGTALLCIAVNTLIPKQPQLIADILARSIFVSIIFVGVNYFLKTSDQMNYVINNTLTRLRIRK